MQKAFANLATIMANGSPQVTAVWFDFDGKYIRIVGYTLTRRFLAG